MLNIYQRDENKRLMSAGSRVAGLMQKYREGPRTIDCISIRYGCHLTVDTNQISKYVLRKKHTHRITEFANKIFNI